MSLAWVATRQGKLVAKSALPRPEQHFESLAMCGRRLDAVKIASLYFFTAVEPAVSVESEVHGLQQQGNNTGSTGGHCIFSAIPIIYPSVVYIR